MLPFLALLPTSLHLKQSFRQFPHGSIPTAALQHGISTDAHRSACVGWGEQQADHGADCEIVEVIAEEGGFHCRDLELFLQSGQSCRFVFNSHKAVLDPELTGPHLCRPCLATAEEGQLHAVLKQQPDSQPIADIKAFEQASFCIKPEASVGQDTIHVQHQQLDLPQLLVEEPPTQLEQWIHASPAWIRSCRRNKPSR